MYAFKLRVSRKKMITPSPNGDLASVIIPAKYSSSSTNTREMIKIKKLRNANICVTHNVDL